MNMTEIKILFETFENEESFIKIIYIIYKFKTNLYIMIDTNIKLLIKK